MSDSENYADQKKAEMNEIFEKLEQGVKDVFQSDKYREYLTVMSSFHRYSYRNQMLIALQKPDATLVAGYNAWKAMKRQVSQGEKGIRILAPQTYKSPVEKDVPILDAQGRIQYKDGQPITERKTVQENKIRFVAVSVFDQSQTTGEPLPSPLKVRELEGVVPERDAILTSLRRVAGIPIEIKELSGPEKGYYHFVDQRIAIRAGMSDLQTIKTSIHEVAHKLLHDPSQLSAAESAELTREKKEVQAESVAFVVSNRLGLDTSDYSFGYIASWSSDKELSELKESLIEIQKVAENIINEVEKELEQYRQNEVALDQRSPATADTPVQPASDTPELELPTVKVTLSEHQEFPAGSTYSLAAFDDKMAILDAEVKAMKDAAAAKGEYEPYYKVNFEINFNINGENQTYKGRQDIGDGEGGVINHIKEHAAFELKYHPSLTDDERQSLVWVKDTFVPYLESAKRVQTLQGEISLMKKEIAAASAAEPAPSQKKAPAKESKSSNGIASRAKVATKKAQAAKKDKSEKAPEKKTRAKSR